MIKLNWQVTCEWPRLRSISQQNFDMLEVMTSSNARYIAKVPRAFRTIRTTEFSLSQCLGLDSRELRSPATLRVCIYLMPAPYFI
jgi:hypothetical protein